MQRIEIVGGVGIFTTAGMIRGDIGRARGDLHGRGKVDLLPAAGGLIGGSGSRQQRAGGAPQVDHVAAGVQGSLIETDPCDVPVCARGKFDTDLDRILVIGVGRGWRSTRTEQAESR